MYRCPQCLHEFDRRTGRCSQCGFGPKILNGFESWAPDLVKDYSGFPTEGFSKLAAVEATNFWFRARNELLLWVASRYFPDMKSMLEVGCGTGFVLSGFAARFSDTALVGSEMFTEGLVFAQQRVPRARLIQMDARRMPFVDEFDVVTSFDVLEHIDEDERVIENMYRAVRPGGGCIITVPQHRWLWSPVDEVARHVRRYEASELHGTLRKIGFDIQMSTSFVSLLLPAMLLSRLRTKKSGRVAELGAAGWLNEAMKRVMDVERLLIRLGLCFPWGGSRLVIATKKS